MNILLKIYNVSFLTFIVFLSGCSTGKSGETVIGKPGSIAWFGSSSIATQNSYFLEKCLSYGFKANSIEIAQCIQKESNETRNRAEMKKANIKTGSAYQSSDDDTKRRLRNLEWDSQMRDVNTNLEKLMRR